MSRVLLREALVRSVEGLLSSRWWGLLVVMVVVLKKITCGKVFLEYLAQLN